MTNKNFKEGFDCEKNDSSEEKKKERWFIEPSRVKLNIKEHAYK